MHAAIETTVVYPQRSLRSCQRTDHRQCHQETYRNPQRQWHGRDLCLRLRHRERAAALHRCSPEPHLYRLGVCRQSVCDCDCDCDCVSVCVYILVHHTSPDRSLDWLCRDGFFGDKWDSAAQPDPNSTTGGWKICNHECGSVTEAQGQAWNAGKA